MTREKLGRKLEKTLSVASRSWTWHFRSASESGWVVPFTGHFTMVPSHHPYLGLMLPIHHDSVADMFKRSHSEDSPVSHPLQHIHPPYFHDRYPEHCILKSFSPPLKSFAPFCVIDVGFIKALLWQIASCWHQLIIQEVNLGTTLLVLWSLHASMASFSLLATGLHHWPSTGRLCMVFDAKSLFHTRWIVLQYLEGHHHHQWLLSCLLTTYTIGW